MVEPRTDGSWMVLVAQVISSTTGGPAALAMVSAS